MKIVKFGEFLKCPEGTVFSYYSPCIFRGLCVKGKSLERDFYYQDVIDAVKSDSSDDFVEQCEKAERGEEVDMDFDCCSREGMFDDDQLYAVYSKDDIRGMIKLLSNA